MSKKNKKNQNEEAKAAQEEVLEQDSLNDEQQLDEKEKLEERIAQLEAELKEAKTETLYRLAELENFRKRTLKEKADLIKNGAESAMRDLLPVVDDLERAMDAMNKGGDLDSLKEGVEIGRASCRERVSVAV